MVKLVFSMKLVAIPSICEVRGESKVCFGAFLRHTKGFRAANKITSPICGKGHTIILFVGTFPLVTGSLRHGITGSLVY